MSTPLDLKRMLNTNERNNQIEGDDEKGVLDGTVAIQNYHTHRHAQQLECIEKQIKTK